MKFWLIVIIKLQRILRHRYRLVKEFEKLFVIILGTAGKDDLISWSKDNNTAQFHT